MYSLYTGIKGVENTFLKIEKKTSM